MTTQWHTEPPKGEHRPLWVTYKNGAVNWSSAISTAWDLSNGKAIAWAEYTPEKPEPYQPPSEPNAEEIEAWRELEKEVRQLQKYGVAFNWREAIDKLDAARGKKRAAEKQKRKCK